MVLDINKTYEVPSYPYGRLRTKAYFSIEFVKGKGFRSVFQTINPKNGRLNAPKKSTYYGYLIQYIESESGHIKTTGWGRIESTDFNGIQGMWKHVRDNHEALNLTPDMIEYLLLGTFTALRVSITARARYNGADQNKLIELIKPSIDIVTEALKTKTILTAELPIDIKAIDALNVEGYNPWTIRSSEPVSLSTLME